MLGMCAGAAKDDPTKGELLVLVRKGESADFIPREIDGVPTRIEYSEPFVADDCSSKPVKQAKHKAKTVKAVR